MAFLGGKSLGDIDLEEVQPDRRYSWVNQPATEFDRLISLADKETKQVKVAAQNRSIFKLFSLGVVTNRDEWAYDSDRMHLRKKIEFFCSCFGEDQRRWEKAGRPAETADFVDRRIKWTSELESHLRRGTKLAFNSARVRKAAYRPFVKLWTYYDRAFTHRLYRQDAVFPIEREVLNHCIVFTDPTAQKPWLVSAVSDLP